MSKVESKYCREFVVNAKGAWLDSALKDVEAALQFASAIPLEDYTVEKSELDCRIFFYNSVVHSKFKSFLLIREWDIRQESA